MLEEDGGKAVMGFSPLEKTVAGTLARERWRGRESMFFCTERERGREGVISMMRISKVQSRRRVESFRKRSSFYLSFL